MRIPGWQRADEMIVMHRERGTSIPPLPALEPGDVFELVGAIELVRWARRSTGDPNLGPRVLRHLVANTISGGTTALLRSSTEIKHRIGIRRRPGPVRWGAFADPIVTLAPNEAFVEYAYTAPQWRGRGLFALILQGVLTHLDEMGVPGIWIDVDTTNRASRRVVGKLGFRESHRVRPRKFALAWWENRGA